MLNIIPIHSFNSVSEITRGGAKRIIFPWVGFASKPLSFNFKHIFHAVLLSSLSLIKIAFNNPLPLTSLTILLREAYSFNFLRKIFPNLYAFFDKFSSKIILRASMAIDEAKGFPPKVLPC